MADGEFSVCQFFPDGTHEYVRRWVDGETAVRTAKSYTERPAAQIGIIVKVIITDGGDNTCFAWKFGKGITYPTQEERDGRGQSGTESPRSDGGA